MQQEAREGGARGLQEPAHAPPNSARVAGAPYSPGRKSLSQPSTRLFPTGFRYRMRPLPASTVAENGRPAAARPHTPRLPALIRTGATALPCADASDAADSP